MSFRKQKPDVDATRQWRDFVAEHSASIHALDLPSVMMESEDHWRDFLHHGHLEVANDWTQYQYPPPDSPGHDALFRLIESYFELRGPCVSLWPGLLSLEEEQIIRTQEAQGY